MRVYLDKAPWWPTTADRDWTVTPVELRKSCGSARCGLYPQSLHRKTEHAWF